MIPLRHVDDDDSVSTITITSSLLPNIDTSRPSMQSNEEPRIDVSLHPNARKIEDLCSLKSSDRLYLSEDSFQELEPDKIPTLLLQQSNINKVSPHSDDDNLRLLEKSINQALSALPSFKPLELASQRGTEKTENLTTSIKETQVGDYGIWEGCSTLNLPIYNLTSLVYKMRLTLPQEPIFLNALHMPFIETISLYP